MFSVLASTRPTALTVWRNSLVGGAEGGLVDFFIERHFHTRPHEKTKATSASSGRPSFFMPSPLLGFQPPVRSLSRQRTFDRSQKCASIPRARSAVASSQSRFDPDDVSVVHPGNGVGKAEDAVVVSHHQNCAIEAHGFCCQQLHHSMTGLRI